MELELNFAIGLATLILGLISYWYMTKNYNYWKKRNVPCVEPGLFFGNLKDVLTGKKALGELYKDIYWKLDGYQLGGFFKFRQPCLLIRDPELIKTVLVKEFNSFQDNDFAIDLHVDPLFGRNPVVLQGNAWKTIRSQLTPCFTISKIKKMYPQVLEICSNVDKYLERHKSIDGIDCRDMTGRMSADAVALCAFGMESNALLETNAPFRTIGIKFLEPTFWRAVKEMCVVLQPQLASLLKLGLTPREVSDFFRNVVKEASTFRVNNNVKRDDYLDSLLQIKRKSEERTESAGELWYNKFTEEDVAAQALTFFTDGYETSSNALMFTLYELAKNPTVQSRLRDHILEALRRNNGEMNYDVIRSIPYLDMVYSEALRIHPPVIFLNRLCSTPFNFSLENGEELHVEAGTPVVIPTWALHMDPQYFPDPEMFDPERFSEENMLSRHKYVYLPFSEGPRICLGLRFGEAFLRCGLVSLLLKYEVQVTDKTPPVLTANPGGFVNVPAEKVYLKFKKLSD